MITPAHDSCRLAGSGVSHGRRSVRYDACRHRQSIFSLIQARSWVYDVMRAMRDKRKPMGIRAGVELCAQIGAAPQEASNGPCKGYIPATV